MEVDVRSTGFGAAHDENVGHNVNRSDTRQGKDPEGEHDATVVVDPVAAAMAAREGRPGWRGRLHLMGAVLALVTAPVLLAAATSPGRRWAAAVFVLSIVVMLGTSAAYHVVRWPGQWLGPMRRADHSAIFIGIAGTYTPLLVTALDGTFRLWMLIGVWAGAVIGIVINNVAHHAPSWVRTLPYLVLGWGAVVLIPALWRLSPSVMWLVVAGGVAYTVGAVVYARRRPDPWPAAFGHHEIFHALTLVAVGLHWVGVKFAIGL